MEMQIAGTTVLFGCCKIVRMIPIGAKMKSWLIGYQKVNKYIKFDVVVNLHQLQGLATKETLEESNSKIVLRHALNLDVTRIPKLLVTRTVFKKKTRCAPKRALQSVLSTNTFDRTKKFNFKTNKSSCRNSE